MYITSRPRLGKSLALGMALLLMLAATLTARPVAAATATLEPTSVVDGTTVMAGRKFIVRGSGFRKDERISTWVSFSLRDTVYATTSGRADSSGNVSIEIKSGRFWEPGWWALTVSSSDQSRKAVVAFKLEPSPPDGMLDVAPARDMLGGERISFHGIGFNLNDSIRAWMTLPNGTAVEIDPDNITQVGGEVYFFYDIPPGLPGRWSATAYGVFSERLLISLFTVTR